jgi:hypothetical protein
LSKNGKPKITPRRGEIRIVPGPRLLQFAPRGNMLIFGSAAAAQSPRIVTAKDILLHPFTLGLALGLLFAAIALWHYLRSRKELRDYKKFLDRKLQVESESMQRTHSELERLRKDNENMRVKIASFNEQPDRRLHRDLEIFARAERRMLISVPGFAPAWENAKNDARAELEGEEDGRSLPKRVFARLFAAPLHKDAPEKAARPEAESP